MFDPSAAIGWSTISLIPIRLSSFRVTTMSPMTFASCISIARRHLYSIHDADNDGVDRTILHPRRHARGAAADDEHGLANASVDSVNRHEVIAFGFAVRIHGARDEQLAADQSRILPRRDNGTDDARENHC